jgi:hypothetical protein
MLEGKIYPATKSDLQGIKVIEAGKCVRIMIGIKNVREDAKVLCWRPRKLKPKGMAHILTFCIIEIPKRTIPKQR